MTSAQGTTFMNEPDIDRVAERRAREALRRASLRLPALRAVAACANVRASRSTATVDVSPKVRIRVRPDFVASLDDESLEFVMAHELMHIQLRTHERRDGYEPRAFNWAHDAVINDTLAQVYARGIPADGIAVPGARFTCAEALLDSTRSRGDAPWEAPDYRPDVVNADESTPEFSRGGVGIFGDRSDATEINLLPDGSFEPDVERRAAATFGFYRVSGRVRAAADLRSSGAAVAALTGWLDAHRFSKSTYARASRRGSGPDGSVTHGRRSDRLPLTVVLDVSSSVVDVHRRLLGVLLAALERASLDELRLVQADSRITSDRRIGTYELREPLVEGSADREVIVVPNVCTSCGRRHGFRPRGAPKTDLCHALVRAALPGSALLVLTDGRIAGVGERPRGVDVAWLATEPFEPGWGRVILDLE